LKYGTNVVSKILAFCLYLFHLGVKSMLAGQPFWRKNYFGGKIIWRNNHFGREHNLGGKTILAGK
jgi:hypothetical protein